MLVDEEDAEHRLVGRVQVALDGGLCDPPSRSIQASLGQESLESRCAWPTSSPRDRRPGSSEQEGAIGLCQIQHHDTRRTSMRVQGDGALHVQHHLPDVRSESLVNTPTPCWRFITHCRLALPTRPDLRVCGGGCSSSSSSTTPSGLCASYGMAPASNHWGGGAAQAVAYATY